MANHKSAKKRIRQNEKRRVNNKWKTSRVRSQIKAIKALMTEGKKEDAAKMMPAIQGMLDKLAKSSALNKKTAARKVARLSSQITRL